MLKKKLDNAIVITLAVTAIALAALCCYKNRQIDNQKIHLELIQEELKNTQGDRDYYKNEYKKYYELAEELQNQNGVYYE